MNNILKDVRLGFISRNKKIDIELRQSIQEGKSISSEIKEAVQQLKLCEDDKRAEEKALEIYEKLRKLPVDIKYPYEEPESVQDIIRCFPSETKRKVYQQDLRKKIEGAWLGRTAGCLLGQPVECWMREKILGFLKDTDNYPIKNYMSSDIPKNLREKYKIVDEPGAYGNKKVSWINNISFAPEDDDLNYTVMGLGIVERYGRQFSSCDVAEYFTLNVPVFMACTAERMAYKNIVNGILPPDSAVFGNPYREWLGAQIRVDAYAYINPGNAYEAAYMAARDAAVTHTKNGIYGAVFCAALIAESAINNDVDSIIVTALEYVPHKSRLYEALKEFLSFCDSTDDPEKAIQWVHDHYNEDDEHDWCHVIPNDMIICLALHYGKKDFSKVIGLAIEAGFDTDCNGATVGSVYGMMYGSDAIPDMWTEVFNGKMMTRIECQGIISFTELVDRCMRLIEKNE